MTITTTSGAIGIVTLNGTMGIAMDIISERRERVSIVEHEYGGRPGRGAGFAVRIGQMRLDVPITR